MKKVIITLAALTVFILSAAMGYAYPGITHMFYDNSQSRLYIFSNAEKIKDGFQDVGVYAGGKKYSILKEEEDAEKLVEINSSDNPRYGIGLTSELRYFDNLLITPYVVDKNGNEMTGNSASYDLINETMKKEELLFFENFTSYSENQVPSTMKFTAYNGNLARIEKGITKEGKEKNMLLLSDVTNPGSVITELPLPEYKEDILVEMKLKLVKTTTEGFGFIMDFQANGNNAFRVIKYADKAIDGIMYSASSSYIVSGKDTDPGKAVEFDGEWFILKMRIDSKRQINQLILESDYYGENDINTSLSSYMWQNKKESYLLNYNLFWYNDYEKVNLDKIVFTTYGKSCGEYYIDYIKITENTEEFKVIKTRAPSKPIQTIPDPVQNW